MQFGGLCNRRVSAYERCSRHQCCIYVDPNNQRCKKDIFLQDRVKNVLCRDHLYRNGGGLVVSKLSKEIWDQECNTQHIVGLSRDTGANLRDFANLYHSSQGKIYPLSLDLQDFNVVIPRMLTNLRRPIKTIVIVGHHFVENGHSLFGFGRNRIAFSSLFQTLTPSNHPFYQSPKNALIIVLITCNLSQMTPKNPLYKFIAPNVILIHEVSVNTPLLEACDMIVKNIDKFCDSNRKHCAARRVMQIIRVLSEHKRNTFTYPLGLTSTLLKIQKIQIQSIQNLVKFVMPIYTAYCEYILLSGNEKSENDFYKFVRDQITYFPDRIPKQIAKTSFVLLLQVYIDRANVFRGHIPPMIINTIIYEAVQKFFLTPFSNPKERKILQISKCEMKKLKAEGSFLRSKKLLLSHAIYGKHYMDLMREDLQAKETRKTAIEYECLEAIRMNYCMELNELKLQRDFSSLQIAPYFMKSSREIKQNMFILMEGCSLSKFIPPSYCFRYCESGQVHFQWYDSDDIVHAISLQQPCGLEIGIFTTEECVRCLSYPLIFKIDEESLQSLPIAIYTKLKKGNNKCSLCKKAISNDFCAMCPNCTNMIICYECIQKSQTDYKEPKLKRRKLNHTLKPCSFSSKKINYLKVAI